MMKKELLFITGFVLMGAGISPNCLRGEDEGEIPPDRTFREEISVTANLADTPLDEVGSSVTIITRKEIENKKETTVLDLLRDVPGVDVLQTGGPGQPASVFIRGAKSEQTLILIDGVELNDPMSPGRSFDFAQLPVNHIERIEILRGPQSTLYGSDAIGGVINIVTTTGEGRPEAFFSFEGGSFSTFREAAGASGSLESLNFSFGLTRQDTDGISAADGSWGNTEADAFKNTSFSGALGAAPAEELNVGVRFFLMDSTVDLDNFGGALGDDPNSLGDTRIYTLHPYVDFSLLDGLWKQNIGFSYADTERTYENPTDDRHPVDLSEGRYQGKIFSLNWKNTFPLHRRHTLIAGAEYQKEEGESFYFSDGYYGPYEDRFEKQDHAIASFYAQDMFFYEDRFFATAGLRYDESQRFDGYLTCRFTGAAYPFNTSTKLHGSAGTGFKAPTLFQLFSMFGSRDLDPEKSKGFDVGIEQFIEEQRISIGLTCFYNTFEDMIDFDTATYTYMNIAEATTKGIEIFTSFNPAERFSGRLWYTYTDTEDQTTGEDLLRRPKHKFGLSGSMNYNEKLNITPSIIFVGARNDWDFGVYPAVRRTLDRYVLASLAASYDFRSYFQAYFRVDNLLDQDYEPVLGYGAPGIGFHAGFKISN